MSRSGRDASEVSDGGEAKRIGSYLLLDEIGRGGMGVVFRARDEVLERDVAIKMITPHHDDAIAKENAARFLVEAKAAGRIKSRHVATVLELGWTPDKAAYFVMELLEGPTLLRVMSRERRLKPKRVLRIAQQIARGLHAAHVEGFIHRDLKPSNVILVEMDGEKDFVKIVDFGLAKKIDGDPITAQGALLGTLQFMAPEQLLGEKVDARTDVFALGVLLYRMLTDRAPFEAKGLADMIDMQLSEKPKAPSRYVSSLTRSIDDIVLRCLEKDRDLRFSSMADLDKALTAALDELNIAQPSLPPGTSTSTLTTATPTPPVSTVRTEPYLTMAPMFDVPNALSSSPTPSAASSQPSAPEHAALSTPSAPAIAAASSSPSHALDLALAAASSSFDRDPLTPAPLSEAFEDALPEPTMRRTARAQRIIAAAALCVVCFIAATLASAALFSTESGVAAAPESATPEIATPMAATATPMAASATTAPTESAARANVANLAIPPSAPAATSASVPVVIAKDTGAPAIAPPAKREVRERKRDAQPAMPTDPAPTDDAPDGDGERGFVRVLTQD